MKNKNDFIGRKIYLSRIRQEIIHNDFSIGISVVGLPSMGKTATVLEALKECPTHINTIYLDLSQYEDPIQFWRDVCSDVKEFINESDFEIPGLESRFKVIDDPKARWIDFLISMNSIFDEVSKAGIKTVFILDEFDSTSQLFKGKAGYFDILRSLILGKDLKISIIAISQKPIWLIERDAATNSSFYPMYDFIALRGFDINDMFEYYSKLEETGIFLDEKQKERIEYYVGQIPYLLSVMRKLLLDQKEKSNSEIDIDTIVKENGLEIYNYHEDLHDKLQEQGDLKNIISLLKDGDSAITLKDKDELILLGYITDRNGNYISFSPYFVDYLKNRYQFD